MSKTTASTPSPAPRPAPSARRLARPNQRQDQPADREPGSSLGQGSPPISIRPDCFERAIALAKRSRTSQNSMTASGANAGANSQGDPRTAAGSTSCWPRKNEPVAMKKATHILHMWRPMRCLPDSGERRIALRSSRPASRVTAAKTKTGPRPMGVAAPPSKAVQAITAAAPSATAQAIISNLPAVPSRRRAVIQDVKTK